MINIKLDDDYIRDYILMNSKCKIISKGIISSNDKIELICECGNKFVTTFKAFKNKNKRQCNDCGKKLVWKNRERPTISSISEYISKNSDAVLLSDVYKYNNCKLEIKCKCGNVFYRTWSNIKRSNLECKECRIKRATSITRKTQTQFETDIKQIFGDKYKAIGEYKGSNVKVDMFCNKCNKLFSMKPAHLLSGHGCSNCCNKSRGEIIIKNFLDRNNLRYIQQYKFDDCRGDFRNLPFDFMVKDILIEFDGKQHFQSISVFGGELEFANRIKNDAIKNAYCEDNNLKLIRIPYWEFKNIEKILTTELKEYMHDNTEPSL